jgi:hypothetical protein
MSGLAESSAKSISGYHWVLEWGDKQEDACPQAHESFISGFLF